MTATEMYNAFLTGINNAANFQVLSWEVAGYLNQAQNAMFNNLFYPEKTKSALNSLPMMAYQSDMKNAEDFAAFRNTYDQQLTSSRGFIAHPANTVRLTAVRIGITSNNDICLDANLEANQVPCRFMRDMERASSGQNIFTRPEWNHPNPVFAKRPKFILDRANGVNGVRILPAGQYLVTREYVHLPTPIEIENPAWEVVYAGNPNYVAVAADVNCQFPVDRHEEIVRMAIAIFLKDRADVTSAKAELEGIDAGLV